jgi:hypothetical protein
LGNTQYHSLLPSLWQALGNWFSETKVHGRSAAWLTPLTMFWGTVWVFFGYRRNAQAWPAERMALWLFGILLVSATVFHPWYILWVLPFASLKGHSFWIQYASMQILGLIPYYRHFLGHPWHEYPGLKWFMIAVPLFIWLFFPRLRRIGSPQDTPV